MAQEIYHRSEWGSPTEQWGNVYLNPDLTNELYKRASEYENSWVTDQILKGIGTKPSIILTPTAYEDGLLNSVKPKGGENLITYSEDFTQWTLGANATLTYESDVIAPDGTSGVYRLQLPATNNTNIFSNIFTSTNPLSTSIYVKSAGQGEDDFNLYTGGSFVSDKLTATSEWQRFEYTAQGSSFYIINSGDTFASDIYIWGAQAERGSKATTYIPTNGTAVRNADFDFTRGSSATRVNELGLVQDVQLLSGELVQNGDFEQIGSELFTNGGFDTDSGWIKTSTVTISNGVANIVSDGSYQYLAQSNITTQNKFYKLVYTIVSNNNGALKFSNGSGSYGNLTSTVGTHIKYFQANTGSSVYIERQSGVTDITIDNVSIKEVGQNWTVTSGATIEDGQLVLSASANLHQNIPLTVGKKYRVKYEITSIDAGSSGITVYGGSTSGTIRKEVGIYTEDIIQSGSGLLFFFTGGGFNSGTIDNVSVVEVTDDTDLPRINYTNFDYENGEVVPYSGEGSLLLEPQSTNLVTYSEDFTQWTLGTFATLTYESDVIAPDGTSGVYRLQLPATNATFLQSNLFTGTNPLSTSIYVKSAGQGEDDFNLYTGGTFVSDKLTATSEWQRFEYTAQGSSFYIINSGDTFASDIYIWGAQAEAGSYPTSYIPTNGSTVTRLADVCKNSGSSDLINSTEGVLYAEISALANDGNYKAISVSDGSYGNRVQFSLRFKRVEAYVQRGPSSQYYHLETVTNILDYHKIALVYKQNDYKLFVNGTLVDSSASGNTFPQNTLTELSFTDGVSSYFYGNVKCVAVFKEALSDTELQKLTTI
jgi:hypothetical protein